MTLVTQSNVPLVAETLPALKVRYYTGKPQNIYAFARMYVLKDTLSVSLYKFERTPAPTSRLAFAVVAPRAEKMLLASVGSQQAEFSKLVLCDTGSSLPVPENTEELYVPAPTWFGGVDEQGWYWGTEIQLSAKALAQAGCVLRPDAEFCAAVFCYTEGEDGLGASFRLPNKGPVVMKEADNFSVVIY